MKGCRKAFRRLGEHRCRTGVQAVGVGQTLRLGTLGIAGLHLGHCLGLPQLQTQQRLARFDQNATW